MQVILCLDDRDGMMFNHRRQSRDRVVVQDILKSLEGKRLWIRPISRTLFQETEQSIQVDERCLEQAGTGDICFVEDVPLAQYGDKIEQVTVYRWNRRYPSDFSLDLDLKHGWRLVNRQEFPGHSHETITKEVYQP